MRRNLDDDSDKWLVSPRVTARSELKVTVAYWVSPTYGYRERNTVPSWENTAFSKTMRCPAVSVTLALEGTAWEPKTLKSLTTKGSG